MTFARANRVLAGDRATAGPHRFPDSGGGPFGESAEKAGAGRPARLRWRRNLCLGLAVVTCPCHLPILAALLSGTAAGALLSEHLALAFVLLLGVFVASLRAAVGPGR